MTKQRPSPAVEGNDRDERLKVHYTVRADHRDALAREALKRREAGTMVGRADASAVLREILDGWMGKEAAAARS